MFAPPLELQPNCKGVRLTNMQRKITAILSWFTVFAFSAFAQSAGEPVRLIAETNHSTIQFSVPISSGLTRITGKFNQFSIDIALTDNDITHSRIKAVIQVSSINTGIAGRDEDLKTADFFDTAKFPEITFASDRIEKTSAGYLATGQFQMHGVTRTIQLPFTITGKHGDTIIGIRSRTSIKRSDYRLGTTFKHTTDDNFIGDEIGVEIDFWTKKSKP